MKKFLPAPLFVFMALLLVDISPAAEVGKYAGVPEKCLKEEGYPQLSEAETRFCANAVSQNVFRDLEKTQADANEARKLGKEIDEFIIRYQEEINKRWRK